MNMRFKRALFVVVSLLFLSAQAMAISESELIPSHLEPEHHTCYLDGDDLRGAYVTKKGKILDSERLFDRLKKKRRKAKSKKAKRRISKKLRKVSSFAHCSLYKESILEAYFGSSGTPDSSDENQDNNEEPLPTATPAPQSTIPAELVGRYRYFYYVISNRWHEDMYINIEQDGSFYVQVVGLAAVSSSSSSFPQSICTHMGYQTVSWGAATVSGNILTLTADTHFYQNDGHNCYSPGVQAAEFTIPVSRTVQEVFQLSPDGETLTLFGQPGVDVLGDPINTYGVCDLEYEESRFWPACRLDSFETLEFERVE